MAPRMPRRIAARFSLLVACAAASSCSSGSDARFSTNCEEILDTRLLRMSQATSTVPPSLVGEDKDRASVDQEFRIDANETEQSWLHILADETRELVSRLRSQASKAQDSFRVSLLTSLFLPEGEMNRHVMELFMALTVNLANPFIEEVHVLLEGASGDEVPCMQLRQMVKWRALTKNLTTFQSLEKIKCAETTHQPTYLDFFRYAKNHMQGRNLMLANTDVVFDETLGLLNPAPDARAGYVVSVIPPPSASLYKRLFSVECDTFPRCTIGDYNGWIFGGSSWDVYILPASVVESTTLESLQPLNHTMNIIHAENHAGYQLELGANIKLSNPCMHVHAFHWHCLGEKMHADGDFNGKVIHGIMPCWDCPGVKMPEGSEPLARLCASGRVTNVTRDDLSDLFITPQVVSLCCPHTQSDSEVRTEDGAESTASHKCQDDLTAKWKVCQTAGWTYDAKTCPVPMCHKASDINCVMYDGARHPHCFGDGCNRQAHISKIAHMS